MCNVYTNNYYCCFMSRGNNRISERGFDGGPVKLVCHKPEGLNQINDSLQ